MPLKENDRDYAHFYFEEVDLEAQLLAIRAALEAHFGPSPQQLTLYRIDSFRQFSPAASAEVRRFTDEGRIPPVALLATSLLNTGNEPVR